MYFRFVLIMVNQEPEKNFNYLTYTADGIYNNRKVSHLWELEQEISISKHLSKEVVTQFIPQNGGTQT